MEDVKIIKGTTIKEIPKAYLSDYLSAGWTEYKEPVVKEGKKKE